MLGTQEWATDENSLLTVTLCSREMINKMKLSGQADGSMEKNRAEEGTARARPGPGRGCDFK